MYQKRATFIVLSLYFSLFHSQLSYGLSVWGTSNDGYLSKFGLKQKKIIRAVTFSDFYAHTSPLFKSLNILKIKDLFNHNISSLMWDFDHHSLPDSLPSMFTRRDEIHNRNLRDKNKIKSALHIVLIIDIDATRSHIADHCY